MSKRKESICQTCYYWKCSWHKDFKPVEGWVAEQTKITGRTSDILIDSFYVSSCPYYTSRPIVQTEYTSDKNSNPWVICSLQKIAEITGLTYDLLYGWIRRGKSLKPLEDLGIELKVEEEKVNKQVRRVYYIRRIDGQPIFL